jgi:membrane fusion protein
VTARDTENLFRRNALLALRARRLGRPIAFMPRPWLWLGVLCAGLMATACAFAWQVEYARKETARGWLVSEQGIARVTHPTSARVTRVLSRAGDRVRRGEAIAYVSSEQVLADGSASTRTILGVLREELAEVDRRRTLAREQVDRAVAAVAKQVRDIDRELAALDSQVQTQDKRVDRGEGQLSRLKTMRDKGAIAEIDLLRQRDDLASMQQALARLVQEKTRVTRERANLVAQQVQLAADLELRLSDLASQANALRERITRNENTRLQAITAPLDGTIATLDLTAGNAIGPQQLLATVIPGESPLVADVYIPSRAVGFIATGQDVRLRYDAFPHDRFGTARGRVESVADFVLLPTDVPPTFGLREASYRVRIRLESQTVTDRHGRYALRPGMLLAAEIVLDNRRLAEWLFARFDGSL